ncbi:Endoglucanase A precursor [Legionella massiliensis]|uniref:Endoglucanase A n=1 Tax=Legionella massiliensis TaxID=1034943 RepID=A0A078KWI4_9GAMM|nr:cellulase family glycosylhydrolase [Legionella massiliensis]CDZ77351.1 Endoglucanase A precursor [Legionella massiliensis]CEE13089.1 Endoglucanase A precursor [Legionella massiliensis]
MGENIVDNDGTVIRLKGFARPSLEWDKQGQFLSEQDFANMKKWGANTIRVSLTQDLWFNSKAIDVKGSYKQIIDAIIYYATQNRMAVILDLHWTKEGAGQPKMANKDSLRFWTEVATKYKDFGTVLFELFNEPQGINKDEWLSGNSQFSGYQQLYEAVRDTGAKNICIINGLEWGFNLDFLSEADQYKYAIKGDNIVYGSHPYRRSYESIYSSLAGVINKYPMLFTEFGDNAPEDYPNSFASSYINTLLFLNQTNGSYTAWAWWVSPANPAFPTLIADWKNATAINGGVIVKDDMEKYPATSLPITTK